MSTDPRVAEAMKLAETYVLADVSWHTLPGHYDMEDAERCENQMFRAKQALEDYLAEQFANLEDALAMVRNSADHRQAEIVRLTSSLAERENAVDRLETEVACLTAELEEVRKDAGRLDWLLPNLNPATWGMDFEGGYEWADDAEFLRKWRCAIDGELHSRAAAMTKEPPTLRSRPLTADDSPPQLD
jgi:uncharacterized coiled-coil protein SlyX